MNLYKLASDPTQLKNHEQTLMPKGKEATTITVSTGPNHDISFALGGFDKNDAKVPTLAKKLDASGIVDSWHGDPEQFDWRGLRIQKDHYEKLKAILARNNLKFTEIWYSHRLSRGSNLHSFIAIAGPQEHPNFIWYKYAGLDPQSGQNWIYPGWGLPKSQLSEFLRYSSEQQDRLMNMVAGEDIDWVVSFTNFEYQGKSAFKQFEFNVKATSESRAKTAALKYVNKHPSKFGIMRLMARGGPYYMHVTKKL